MLAASAARIMVSNASREFAMRTEAWFFRYGSRPCGSLAFRVCGTSGRRITLMPMPEISDMVCAMVRPVPWLLLAQNVLPMYCSIGAPLGLVGSSGGSWRPSRPNQEPQRTGKCVPFLVMRPCGVTRNSAFGLVLLVGRVTVMVPGLYPEAVAVNVAFTDVVPVAALNVMFTPCQLLLLNVTEVGVCVIAVLPAVRVMVTGTVVAPLGAALKRSDELPLPPLFTDRVFGTKLMVGVLAVMVKDADATA